MKKLLLPLVLLVLGLGGGVGAGLALAPPEEEAVAAEACAAPAEAGAGHGEAEAAGHDEAAGHGEPADSHGEPDAHGAADTHDAAPCEEASEEAHGDASEDDHAEASAAAPDGSGHGEAVAGGHDYVKLPNQFIVPLVDGGEVAGLMLISLSVEVPAGAKDGVAPIEPKLRDSFLQVLFDHANTGGFDGMFTASGAMRALRAALLDAAEAASEGLVTDVLIVEMVREDR